MRYEVASTDILIIGGGGAGLRAAIEARKHNVQVTLVSKRKAGHFNSTALAAGLVTCSCRDPDKELLISW